MINTKAELEKALLRAHLRIAELTRPPTLEIVHHEDTSDPFPLKTQFTFQWRDYRHSTVVDTRSYKQAVEYRNYILQQGVEACVRAHAEAELTSLVTTEETFSEHYRRVRS